MTPALKSQILDRLSFLVQACAETQYTQDHPVPGAQARTIVEGEYPAVIDLTLDLLGEHKLFNNLLDANGATIMGLWFLSQGHLVLEQVRDPEGTIADLRARIIAQIERARGLPAFFQGDSGQDVLGCPAGTMGWYPLVDGARLPAMIPDLAVELLTGLVGSGWKTGVANLSDGDIWSWCMAVDQTTPGVLRYGSSILGDEVYVPLLGSSQRWELLDADARAFYRQVRGDGDAYRFPIGTFYGIDGQSNDKRQQFSCAVMANILSSIPLLRDVWTLHSQEIDNAASFVRDAFKLALAGQLVNVGKSTGDAQLDNWKTYAYDYYTIPIAPLAYTVRAQKRIDELGVEGYPELLDLPTLVAAFGYAVSAAELRLSTIEPGGGVSGEDYATLVYCFNALMNLRAINRELHDATVCERLVEVLLTPFSAAWVVPGTGPYKVAGPLGASIGSVCFVVPPLIEAYALYMLIEEENGE